MPVIEVNGAALDYGDTGGEDKPVVVLLHGWLGTWDYEFGPEIEWLRSHYRVLALSLRGYGRSEPKPRTFGRDFYRRDAQDVIGWLDALGIRQAHLAGFSDGGEVAILLPILRPDLVRSVAAWGSVGYFPPSLRATVQRYWPATWVSQEIRALHGAQPVDQMVLGWVSAINQIIDTGGNISLTQAHHIACPFLLMLGRYDDLNPEYLGRQLVDRTVQGRLVMFNCGHSVHREQTELFRQALWDHLQSAEAGVPG